MGERTINEQLIKFLTDVHSIEVQALAQMERAPDIAGDAALTRIFADHLDETRGHERLVLDVLKGHRRLVEERLEAQDARPSHLQDTALRLGGLNLAGFLGAQPDTPVKLAGFAFAFEHF